MSQVKFTASYSPMEVQIPTTTMRQPYSQGKAFSSTLQIEVLCFKELPLLFGK